MSDLNKRLREAGHNFNLPTVSEAIARANKFEGEAHLIVQLYPRDFDSIVLRDRIGALEECLRECVYCLEHDVTVERSIALLNKARALLEGK